LKLKKFRAAIFPAIIFFWGAGKTSACGPFFPNNLLDAGDQAVLQAPVTDFRRELERMKLVTANTRAIPPAGGQQFHDQSSEVEMTDLAAALKRGKISSGQAAAIMQAHLAERMKLNAFLSARAKTNPPPVFPDVAVTPGLPREFADYFEGAIAWHNGGGWPAAKPWERLLQLPPLERHFKSTWAAFMLAQYYDGTTNDLTGDKAMKYFDQVRALAKDGFADSPGLATASIGGEARIFLRRKNYERAIELYLEQFAAGNDSAVNSLRFTAARAAAETNLTPAQLKSLALNPRTRRVITAYLISRNPYIDPHEAETDPQAKQFFDRTTAWLEAVESAGVKDVESACQFALAAYQASRMEIAQRWINRAGSEPVAQWLQAKLFMRSGKIAGAAKLLAKLSRRFPQEPPGTNAPASLEENLYVTVNPVWNDSIPIGRQAFGELGALHLARREYTGALDALLRSGYWMDAAYVAERVLTVEELKTYVDREWQAVMPAETAKETVERHDGDWRPTNIRQEIRYLLARRLARINRDNEARQYFPAGTRLKFDALMAALCITRDESLPRDQRAKALYAASWMTRTNGMELFGTEAEPDWLGSGGSYNWGGVSVASRTNESFKILGATSDELNRARKHAPDPDARFHYRYQAATLAFEAAQLMPDNSNETARVLCTAGSWIKYLDPKKADPIYKTLVRRCGKTAIGRQADLMRWFPVLDAAGNPIPYKPRTNQSIQEVQFDTTGDFYHGNPLHMIDGENGWTQSANAIFRTSDGGKSWRRVLAASREEQLASFFYNSQTAWVAAVFGESSNVTTLRTTDGGNSWIHADLCQVYVNAIQYCFLSFPDTDKGWLMIIPDHGMNSMPGVLYRTDNGGRNWQLVNSTRGNDDDWDPQGTQPGFADRHPYLVCGGSIAFQNASNGWLLGSITTTTPAFLFATRDAGQTWQAKKFPLPPLLHNGQIEPEALPRFFPMDGNNGIVGAFFCPTNNNDSTNFCTVIYNTHDGGLTWQPTTPVKYGGAWNFITEQKGLMWSPEPHDSNSTAPVKGVLYRTDDGGITWMPVRVNKGLQEYLTHGEDVVQLDFVDEACGWAIARDWRNVTQLLHTTDGGQTWSAVQMKMPQ
jgi:photosystem II stability/assembly factor-like uncharacterized protein/tetratricopeptide (TPR) repeat protein